MGWLFTANKTKADVVADLTKEVVTEHYSRRTLAHSVRGNVLWAVCSFSSEAKSGKFILCALLGSEKGFGWGYKDMDHTSGPSEVSCPLKFLSMLSPEELNAGYGAQWADRVRAVAATKKAQANTAKAAKVGDTVTLITGLVVTLTSVEGKRILGRAAGTNMLYRIPSKLLPLSAG